MNLFTLNCIVESYFMCSVVCRNGVVISNDVGSNLCQMLRRNEAKVKPGGLKVSSPGFKC